MAVLLQDDKLSTKEVCHHPEECSSSKRKSFALSQLFFIVANAPDSLKHSIIPCMLKGHPVDRYIRASENFISDRIVNTVGLIPKRKSSKINLALSELSAIVLGRVTGDHDILGPTYKNFLLE